jgi:hypothetical protein
MGMIVYIHRTRHDGSNGGLSSRHDELTIVNVDGPFEPAEHRPAALLVERNGHLSVVPAVADGNGGWVQLRLPDHVGPMHGGTIVDTSDSRWHRATGGHPVSLHDRYETTALYASLSKD